MGPDYQGLGLGVRNTANSHISAHLLNVAFKLGSEWSIFDIVDSSLESLLGIIQCHSTPLGSKVRMIVCSEKQIKYTVFA